MKKVITTLFLLSSFVFGQNAWINEFHYDNGIPANDEGEFIEVALENPSTYTLSDFTVTLYNGSNGSSYGTHKLSTFTEGITENNITLFYKNISNIQNGSPDGFSLDYQGNVIQFLSYEGTFSAVDGPAIGMTSTDVGVLEGSSTNAGESLQLTGTGTQYSDFSWSSPSLETKGTSNNSQVLPVELTTFAASVVDRNVELNWETATEVNNYGFEIERQYQESSVKLQEWEKISFVEGHGNSNSPKYYSYTDNTLGTSGKYVYRLKQIDIDGTYEYSEEVEINFGSPEAYELSQNYPNPFNPTTSIKFNLPADTYVKLNVYNILGEKVTELVNTKVPAGYHNVTFNGKELNSGIYFYKLETNNFTQIRKMILLK